MRRRTHNYYLPPKVPKSLFFEIKRKEVIIPVVKTPYGFECPYFFGDYYRGRDREECRLIDEKNGRARWDSSYCRNCPVPAIYRANACPNMVLTAQIIPGILGIGRRIEVRAFCTQSKTDVREPQIGCGNCHPLPPEFRELKT